MKTLEEQLREITIRNRNQPPQKPREMDIPLYIPEEATQVRQLVVPLYRTTSREAMGSPPRPSVTDQPAKKLDGRRHLPIAALAQDIHDRDGRDGVAVARMREVRRGIDKLIDATLGEYRADGAMPVEDASRLLDYIADALRAPSPL